LEEYDAFVEAAEPQLRHEDLFKHFSTPIDVDDASIMDQIMENRSFKTGFDALMNNATAGHYDVRERNRDMDRDGVAAEIIFHGSQNGQCFPFINKFGGTFSGLMFVPLASAYELELAAVGQHMYNRWLADQCSVEPERRVGLAFVPMWDIDAAVRELEWAHDAGVRGLNFPAPKPGMRTYDDLEWDRFWAVCEERGIVLSTHDGAGIDDLSVKRGHTLLATALEGDLIRKMFPRLIFGGTFERFPELKIALVELQQATSSWWTQTTKRYDQYWMANRKALGDQVPRPPSEYFAANVFLGQTLLHSLPSEVDAAVRDGYASNIMWGLDYPHQEGAYRHQNLENRAENRARLALRNAFCHAPPEQAKAMIGETAARVYQMDLDKLAVVARRIDAITLHEVGVPLDTHPEEWDIIREAQVPFPEFHPDVMAATT
jgi:predicted TIM-barrel fold metal-dependent hydrolase